MKDVTKILAEAADGDSGAAGKLLPLVTKSYGASLAVSCPVKRRDRR